MKDYVTVGAATTRDSGDIGKMQHDVTDTYSEYSATTRDGGDDGNYLCNMTLMLALPPLEVLVIHNIA